MPTDTDTDTEMQELLELVRAIEAFDAGLASDLTVSLQPGALEQRAAQEDRMIELMLKYGLV